MTQFWLNLSLLQQKTQLLNVLIIKPRDNSLLGRFEAENTLKCLGVSDAANRKWFVLLQIERQGTIAELPQIEDSCI
jgi:hypothetical protein